MSILRLTASANHFRSGSTSPNPTSSSDELLHSLLKKPANASAGFGKNLSAGPSSTQLTDQLTLLTQPVSRSELVEMMNELVGTNPTEETVAKLVAYVHDALQETEFEKEERLVAEAAQNEREQTQAAVDHLFDAWDNDCSGSIDATDISTVYRLWKLASEEDAALFTTEMLTFLGLPQGSKIRKADFSKFVLYR